jgi:hypothetical protein
MMLISLFRIHHQKSRYIYDLFFKRKAISRELYQFCINENIADAALIAKWKKVRDNTIHAQGNPIVIIRLDLQYILDITQC